MSDQTPIATYRERLLQVSRVLELFPDRLEVRARWRFGGQFAMTIPLGNLQPQPREMWVRQRLFKRALSLGAMAAATAVVITQPGFAHVGRWVAWALYAAATVAGIITLLSYPKVLFMRFPAVGGKPGLDVAAAGPDRAAFPGFIDQVKRQIRKQ